MIDICNKVSIKREFEKRNININFLLKKCSSTQIFAKSYITKNDIVVVAKKQKGGIGRLERKFISKNGGIYFSLITFDKKENVLRYISYISVSVAEVLNSFGIEAKIKWPNDILVNGKKICGIICSSQDFQGKKKIIMGVGINNFNDISLIEDIATTIKKEGINKKRSVVLSDVIEKFYQIRKIRFTEVQKLYKKYFTVTDKEVSIIQGEVVLKGKIKGIDKNGFMILKTDNGEKTIYFGDVLS